jgi:hypothetical protein
VVKELTRQSRVVEVFNLHVKDLHTYAVSDTGVLVHNKPLARGTLEEAPDGVVATRRETVKVYRGINESHVDFARQSRGVVNANRKWWQFWRQKSTPYQHNAVPGGTLDSPYTSWTTDPHVAENFALRLGNTSGVVIQAEVPASCIVTSPNTKSVSLI